jgi:hypothetical protein
MNWLLRSTAWLLAGCVANSLIACGGGGGSDGGGASSAASQAPTRKLEPVTPTSLTAVAGDTVAPAPTVRLTGPTAEPVSGVSVSFIVTGGGSVANASALTGADGTATAGAWRLGQTVGSYTLTARATGLADVVFTALAQPGSIASVSQLPMGSVDATPGATLSSPLQVRVTDAFGNAVAGARVTFRVVSGDGTVAGAVTESNLQGVATSGSWTLGPGPGTQQVEAEADGISTVFSVLPCDAACRQWQLVFVRDGQLFMLDLQSGNTRQLTNDVDRRDMQPAWSPDARRVAFVRYPNPVSGPLVWHRPVSDECRRITARAKGRRPPLSGLVARRSVAGRRPRRLHLRLRHLPDHAR